MNDEPDVRSLVLLGVWRQLFPRDAPTTAPESVERVGHWEVSTYEHCVQWRCLCGRSKALLLSHKEHQEVSLPKDGLHSCEICRAQIKEARCKSDRLAAWLEANRSILDPDLCLEIPTEFQEGPTPIRERFSRIRRFVFTKFWRKPVTSDHYVHLTCNNAFCINPYHLCQTHTPASKLPERTLKEVQQLLLIGLSSQGIRNHLQEQHSIKLSLRSIQRIASGLQKQKN